MDKGLRSRAIVVGHLSITAPAIAVVLLIPLLGLRMFGPFLLVYYVLAGITVAWQWYSAAVPAWKKWLAGKSVQNEEAEHLAHRVGLVWPGETTIGPFSFHTTAAAVCGVHLGPWLLFRWFAWILPLTGMGTRTPTGNDYLQHFELASIAPALVVGYLLSRHLPRLATSAWLLPTVILAYKLLIFTEPYTSVMAPHSSSRFLYFFDIQRSTPTFTPGFGGVDPVRVAQQMFVVAPFYAGLAYSFGAVAERYNALRRIFGHSGLQTESEVTQNGTLLDEYVAEAEKPANQLD
jgi:hypothetical protein